MSELEENSPRTNPPQNSADARSHTQMQADARSYTHPHADAEPEEMPTDDEYALTVKSAVAYSTMKGAPIPERTIYDNAERKVIKSWKSPAPGSEILLGRSSLDVFIHKWLEKKALRGQSQMHAGAEISNEPSKGIDKADRIENENSGKEDLQKKVEELEADNIELRINDAAKKEFIVLMKEERSKLLEDVKVGNHRIGVLETRLDQIEAPKVPSTDSPKPQNPAKEIDKDEQVQQKGADNQTTIHEVIEKTDNSTGAKRLD